LLLCAQLKLPHLTSYATPDMFAEEACAMETTMTVAVPEALQEFVQARVAEGGYGSASEYIRELIRADQKQRARAVLEAEVLKGARSGPSVPMTDEDWEEIRDEVRQRFEARKSG
jgi:antitoxin ParD1/3/4